MEIVFKDVAKVFTVGQAVDYYSGLGLAVEVNDGRDITLEIEKPPAGKQKGQM